MQISEAESVVMEVLWQRSPQTSEEVVAALGQRQEWQEATIKTLLNRLLNKGAIEAQKDGRRYLYSPKLRREDWVYEIMEPTRHEERWQAEIRRAPRLAWPPGAGGPFYVVEGASAEVALREAREFVVRQGA